MAQFLKINQSLSLSQYIDIDIGDRDVAINLDIDIKLSLEYHGFQLCSRFIYTQFFFNKYVESKFILRFLTLQGVLHQQPLHY